MQAILAVKKDLSLFDFSMDTAVAWRFIQQAAADLNRSSFHHEMQIDPFMAHFPADSLDYQKLFYMAPHAKVYRCHAF